MTNLADELERIAAVIDLEVARGDGVHADMDVATIRRAAEALRWVSVEERLPELKDGSAFVIAANAANGEVERLLYRHGAWWWQGTELYGITHWMPLPEPPEPKR